MLGLLPIDEFRVAVKEWSDEKLISERGRLLGWNEHTHAIDTELARRPQAAIREQIVLLTQEVGILSNSSERLELLTVKLKNLTWALILLTILAAVVPVLIESWKASRHEVQDVRVVDSPQSTSPQTPTRPSQ